MSQTEEKLSIQKRIKNWLSNLIRENIISLFVIMFSLLFFFLGAFVSFLTEFSAGLLGIYLGLQLDRIREQRKKNQNKKDLLHQLHTELEEIKTKLFPQTKSVLMLYPDIWNSAISSGQIRLLNSEQITKFTKVFRFIRGTQYEAERVRDAIEEYNSVHVGERKRKAWLENRYKELWARHNKRGEQLSLEIENILKEKWWKA